MHNIFLIGYYGYNNLGDEALLSAITSYLKQQGNMKLSVLSYCASETENEYGVQGISRSKGLGIFKAILKSQAIIGGGGSLLQDTTSSKSLYYYSGILLLGKLLGKKVYLVGNGFGPVHVRRNQRFLKWLMPKFDGVISRDQEAHSSFVSYGVPRVYDGVDCVFLKDPLSLPDTFGSDVNKRPYVALSLRPWSDSEQTIDVVAQAIDYLDSIGYDTVLIPMKNPDDIQIGYSVQQLESRVGSAKCKLEDVERIIAGSSFVIGMRLHALILAAIHSKPFVAISYDPKVTAFTEQVDQQLGGHTQNLRILSLKSSIDYLHHNLDAESQKLALKVDQIKSLAHNQMEILYQWLITDIK